MADSTFDPARRRRNGEINRKWAKRMDAKERRRNARRRPGHVRNVKRGPTHRPGHPH